MRNCIIALLVLLTMPLNGQIKMNSTMDLKKQSFPLATKSKVCNIYIDKTDFNSTEKVSNLLAEDIGRVTGKKAVVSTNKKIDYKEIILVGTLGYNSKIDELVKAQKIDVSPIRNSWERFIIKTVINPFPGVEKALIIAGSDRRGTAYGVFSVSEAIGVSPWYWWADVPVKKQSEIYIEPVEYISKAPSVKYRGVFLNDEDWGLFPWAGQNMDKDIKDIGPKTYAKIFELVLRLKGNMVAPAMHSCTGAFYKYPDNKLVADSFGVIMTTSHCEPLMYNNASEWVKKVNGEWNYLTNKEGILKVLDNRVSEASPFDNIYTVVLRGIHDGGLIGVPENQKVSVLESAITEERKILSKYIRKPIEEIPQIFVPYKEVLNIYEKGLKLPDDVTIVWPDDNFGYIKRLSNKDEQKRKGGSGVYYHISYLGEPNDYLWLNSTPPALMYEEMKKAYDTGADRYWLLNVGDIKPGEMGMQLFLDMAWDMDRFNSDNIPEYESNQLALIFGNKYKVDFKYIKDVYYWLAFSRKPEYMSWGFKWNSLFQKARITDTDYSFVNYNEAEGRIEQYDAIAAKTEKIFNSLPEEYKSAFFQLVYYPVKGAGLRNKEMLVGQQNRWYALQGRSLTNELAEKVKLYHDSLDMITKDYNSLSNGKWNKMMTAPGSLPKPYLSPTSIIPLPESSEMALFLPGEDDTYGVSNFHVLPCFSVYSKRQYFIDVYNKGAQSMSWKAQAIQDWIKLDKTNGNIKTQDRLKVSVDWSKVPTGEKIKGEIEFTSGSQREKVFVSVFNPQTPGVSELQGLYIEDNGVIAINPGNYHRKSESESMKIKVLDGIGYENKCIQLGSVKEDKPGTVSAEYDFYTFNAGSVTVYTYALPLFAQDREHKTAYGVQIDDGILNWATTAAEEYSHLWKQNVIRNSAINITTMNIDKPGKHTLKLTSGDPGMVIQKIVIDLGGMKRSYLGPNVITVK
ncbi:MAG: glycosyl hydrolase 115 family protein [Bacteroidota bacterium]|nr:glycosyl hydrolase 115 family protein [Bacteroidota bacterium]